ncbi:unnamed protein product [Protopolystoma xenopodis]|uniref:Dynein heavy chain AAA module D4 domain-containing protein n=1 Tax=Protopolystoma xenopodis TaxID=117903 RepID=A0A448X8J3_9PLAT|nr:unnamed protein product [Protopolystoma xenopodis]
MLTTGFVTALFSDDERDAIIERIWPVAEAFYRQQELAMTNAVVCAGATPSAGGPVLSAASVGGVSTFTVSPSAQPATPPIGSGVGGTQMAIFSASTATVAGVGPGLHAPPNTTSHSAAAVGGGGTISGLTAAAETTKPGGGGPRSVPITKETVWKYFRACCSARLHIVLAMSPVGPSLRNRCRDFPGIVNCTTIDWFFPWPEQALYAVACSLIDPKVT